MLLAHNNQVCRGAIRELYPKEDRPLITVSELDALREQGVSEDYISVGLDSILEDGGKRERFNELMSSALDREYPSYFEQLMQVRAQRPARPHTVILHPDLYREVLEMIGCEPGPTLNIGGVPVVIDRDCPPDKIFVMPEPKFTTLVARSWDGLDKSVDPEPVWQREPPWTKEE